MGCKICNPGKKWLAESSDSLANSGYKYHPFRRNMLYLSSAVQKTGSSNAHTNNKGPSFYPDQEEYTLGSAHRCLKVETDQSSHLGRSATFLTGLHVRLGWPPLSTRRSRGCPPSGTIRGLVHAWHAASERTLSQPRPKTRTPRRITTIG